MASKRRLTVSDHVKFATRRYTAEWVEDYVERRVHDALYESLNRQLGLDGWHTPTVRRDSPLWAVLEHKAQRVVYELPEEIFEVKLSASEKSALKRCYRDFVLRNIENVLEEKAKAFVATLSAEIEAEMMAQFTGAEEKEHSDD